MRRLEAVNAVAVLAELYDCNDGVVKSVDFSCGVSAEQKTCVVSIECVSLEPRFVGTGPVNKSGRGTWVCAKFRIQGVTELKFEMVGSTFEFLNSISVSVDHWKRAT